MSELISHFEAAFRYGIVPFVVFSLLNLLCASALAYYAKVRIVDAQLFGLSFGAIGIAVGLMMGVSRDSVVGTVVPAILTFLSGFAVYQFGKDAYQKWRPVLPIALLCLVLSTLCAAIFGASERKSFTEQTRRYEEWRIQYEKIEIPIRAKQLEKELGLLPDKPKEAPPK